MRGFRFIKWLILGLIVADVSGRQLVLKHETRFDFVSAASSDSKRLIIFVHGVLTDSVRSSLLIVPTWREYGDVLLASASEGRFVPATMVDDLSRWINSNGSAYEEIVFIGASKGGLVVYDELTQLSGYDGQLKAVIMASPPGARYFKPPFNVVSAGMWGWWAGPISNATIGKLFLKFLFVKPEEENIEPGVDRAELADRVNESQASDISVYADDIRYMISHEPLQPNALIHVRGVYIRSGRDIIVSDDAYEPWNLAFGGDLALVESDTTHVGLPEMPDAFKRDTERGFALIGVTK